MNNENTMNEILEIVQFLKDNAVAKTEAVTKDDLNSRLAIVETKFETRFDNLETRFEDRLTETKSEIITHVDGFIHLHEKLGMSS